MDARNMMQSTLLLALTRAAVSSSCTYTVDSNDPVHGPVRAGDDISCDAMQDGNSSVAVCAARCCGNAECESFSFNVQWNLGPYLDCIEGKDCCCLKNSVTPLEPNKWDINITSGIVSRPCTGDLDCSLNGRCLTNGTCACDKAWKGSDCGLLNLVPMASIKGAYQFPVTEKDCKAGSCGPSTWGGLPLRDENGTYHIFASQFVQNCTLAGWNPGSTVVRATSTKPEGPYHYSETVFETFHHNPTVRRLTPQQSGTGQELFVMWMIGDDVPPPSGIGAACQYDAAKDPHHLEGYVAMAWSPSLVGPWTHMKHAVLTAGDVNQWDAMPTNPAPFIMDNGTSYLFFRGTEWPVNGYERIGLAKAAHWKGPYERVSDQPIFLPASDQEQFVEDPFVWRDERGFHMLAHGHFDENGYLGYAKQVEGPWHFRKAPTYTNVIEMQNGSAAVTMLQRERPQIYFNETTGAPAFLFTGVAPPYSTFYGYTYTFAQPINQ